ncbi:protein EFR3 homolog B-like [Acropora palmata]|uniref:protein EFR3 homolog B-like n=1 Tax=Acropora palmata TaxID=6131 RepID=UPI003DA108F1
MASSHICSCVGNCRPRYKRLVDNIYPPDPRQGLVKSNMDKLIFYALSSPEKLDRIGAYLARKLNRDVERRRFELVFITVEALDQLLLACHAPNLNLFVESFLKMVQKLLESSETDLQVLGSTSFVKFANIEEDTPSYHRRYDFFVSKFSAMCWFSTGNEGDCFRIRLAGLKGLQGVVRKTVSDDLQANIMDDSHMSKIIPSLLFVMEGSSKEKLSSNQEMQSTNTEEDPASLAESCLRELINRASYGNIKSIINPALTHFDKSDLWVPNDFAQKVFKIVLYSVQNQFNYIVIEKLLSHLDDHLKDKAKVKASIVQVLAECVAIASKSSIGPTVLEVFNTLLRHLRSSVDARFQTSAKSGSGHENDGKDEREFEESLVCTVGAFAAVLPDFQKTDIMMFIMGKFPMVNGRIQSSHLSSQVPTRMTEGKQELQKMLLQCLLSVAQSFSSLSLASTFSPTFLESLLQATVVDNSTVRKLAHEILYTILDRTGNISRVGVKGVIDHDSDMKFESCSKQDLIFFRKNKVKLLWYLFESVCMVSNSVENIVVIFLTLAVVTMEVASDFEVIASSLQWVFGLQEVALNENLMLPSMNRCALHSVVAAYLHLVASMLGIQDLTDYISSIRQLRKKEAEFLTSERALNVSGNDFIISAHGIPKRLLFDIGTVREALQRAGCDTRALKTPYRHQPLKDVLNHQLESESVVSNIDSEIGANPPSSPGVHQSSPKERVTFQILKDIVSEKAMKNSHQSDKSAESPTFLEIASDATERTQEFNSKVLTVLDVLNTPLQSRALSLSTQSLTSNPSEESYVIKFPGQYVL